MARHRPPKHIRQRIAVQKQREIARERIEMLAKHVCENPDSRFVQQWIRLIVRIARLSKTEVPKSLAGRFCYDCYRLWVPGRTFTVRVKSKRPVLICACGAEWPLKQRVFR
jgi:RNase P subunit RPR2